MLSVFIFYHLLDLLDLVHELHLFDPPDVLELHGRPDHTQQKQKQKQKLQKQQRGRALRASPLVVAVDAVVSIVSVSVSGV